jgi:hypothetical protein
LLLDIRPLISPKLLLKKIQLTLFSENTQAMNTIQDLKDTDQHSRDSNQQEKRHIKINEINYTWHGHGLRFSPPKSPNAGGL